MIVLSILLLSVLGCGPARTDVLPREWSESPTVTTDLAWTRLQWENDDKEYHDLRISISKDLAKSTNAFTTAQSYRKDAIAHPKDSRKLFSWGYSHYYAYQILRVHGGDVLEFKKGAAEALKAMCYAQAPRCYEYDRVRFLLASILHYGDKNGVSEDLVSLGKRLVKKDPKDVYVRFYFADYLGWTFDPVTIGEGIAMAKDLADEYPSFAGYRAQLVIYNSNAYRFTGAMKYYREAMAQFELLKKYKNVDAASVTAAEGELGVMERHRKRAETRR